jgi:hypothetical protein
MVPNAAFGVRNLHFRCSEKQQIPRYARNDKRVEMSQHVATFNDFITR